MEKLTTRQKISNLLNDKPARLTADELIKELDDWAENGPDDMSSGQQLILREARDRLKLYRGERRAFAHNIHLHEPECDYWCDQYEWECSCGIKKKPEEIAF